MINLGLCSDYTGVFYPHPILIKLSGLPIYLKSGTESNHSWMALVEISLLISFCMRVLCECCVRVLYENVVCECCVRVLCESVV